VNEIGIEIEAALAFGTGHHGTRALLAGTRRLGETFLIPPLKGEGRSGRRTDRWGQTKTDT